MINNGTFLPSKYPSRSLQTLWLPISVALFIFFIMISTSYASKDACVEETTILNNYAIRASNPSGDNINCNISILPNDSFSPVYTQLIWQSDGQWDIFHNYVDSEGYLKLNTKSFVFLPKKQQLSYTIHDPYLIIHTPNGLTLYFNSIDNTLSLESGKEIKIAGASEANPKFSFPPTNEYVVELGYAKDKAPKRNPYSKVSLFKNNFQCPLLGLHLFQHLDDNFPLKVLHTDEEVEQLISKRCKNTI